MGQHELGQPVSKRRLANSRLSTNHPGVRYTSAFVGIKQCRFGIAMAKQRDRLARTFGRVLLTIVCTHGTVVSAIPSCSGLSRSATIDQMRSATTSRGARPSMMMQRFGSSAASVRYA